MGLLDRLFGRGEERGESSTAMTGQQGPPGSDEQALERYRYMLRTAPPETIEQAHEEAFAKLTPEQRGQVLQELSDVTPPEERAAMGSKQTDPKSLARLATRAEMREPGVMERTFARPGMGMGGMMAGTIFGSLVAGFVGSMIAQQFFDSMGDAGFGDMGQTEPVASDQSFDSAEGGFADVSGDLGGDIGGDI